MPAISNRRFNMHESTGRESTGRESTGDEAVTDPTARCSYRVWTEDIARYGDTDRQGHLNNAVFSTYFESGRVAFLMNGNDPGAPPGHSFVIVRLAIDFRREMHWGGRVEIGSAVAGIGRSSFTVRQAIFQGGTCTATAESVIVLMNDSTRRAALIPDELRRRLTDQD
jgi:acyl-CoA thioester hydrolase